MEKRLHPERAPLISISEEKLENSPYLRHWADQKNLQIASAAYTEIRRAGFTSLEDLSKYLAASRETINEQKGIAVEADKKLSALREIIRYAEQYSENLPYKRKYEKSKDPDEYYQKHESEILLCDGALCQLKSAGIDPAKLDLDALRKYYADLKHQKAASVDSYTKLGDRLRDLEQLQRTIEQYLQEQPIVLRQRKNNDILQ